MIILIDNYDSFSYNLFQLIGQLTPDIEVIRNDAMTVRQISERKPEAIILSPGPGRPEDAGICIDIIRELGKNIPILGVCLGHQAICATFGAEIVYAKQLMHGKQSLIKISEDNKLFKNCPDKIPVARYHSLAAENPLPDCLKATAMAEDGEIMAVEHKTFPIFGVQFHPESILTPDGETILENFLRGTKQ